MTGRRQLKQQIEDLLAGLGSCRSEIADTLRGLGVRAAPRNPEDCAVAVYLRAVLGADLRVHSLSVRKDRVKVISREPRRLCSAKLVTVPLPEPVREFIVAFDEMAYPTLTREVVERVGLSGTTSG